jgi:hypothetical protein
MKAYKGFNKDLKCIGYQFQEGKVHKEKEANCVKNGFHCAENPLDCLYYYPNWNNSVYYIVEAAGDLDEDGRDSKISCTELTLIKRLNLLDFVSESMEYMKRYPRREWNSKVSENKAYAGAGFVIARGKEPMAAGEIGTVFGIAKERENSSDIEQFSVFEVDGIKILPKIWYTVSGEVAKGMEAVE